MYPQGSTAYPQVYPHSRPAVNGRARTPADGIYREIQVTRCNGRKRLEAGGRSLGAAPQD